MIRLMRAARSGILGAAALAGTTALLIALAGNPVPARAPTAGQFQAWVDAPFDPRYAAATARTFAWLLWAVVVVAVMAAATARLRRLRLGRLAAALPGPVQGLTAALVGAAAVTTTTSGIASAAPPAATTATACLPPADTGSGGPLGLGTTPATARHDGPAARATGTAAAPRPPIQVATRDNRTAGAATRYRVEPGDNLWDLAGTHLGDPHRWREIYVLNRGHRQTDGHALTDPDDIDVNWVLELPARHPDTRQVAPPATHPASPTGAVAPPTSSLTPPTAPTSITSPTVTRPHQDDGSTSTTAPTPWSNTASPGNPAASGTPPPETCVDHGRQAPSASQLDGIDLPGGWITTGLGAGLLVAVAMVWRRRCNRYKPTPITTPHLDDPDLLPPLAAMTRIRTTLRRTAPETLDDQPAVAPTVREYQSATVKPELPPIGPTGSDLAGAADLPLSTGLGLTGEGALDAARGLLVATLAAGSDDDPDAKGHAIIPASTLATLLGVSAVDLGQLERLTVTDTDADAITALEEEIIRRSRLIADFQVADVRTLRDTDIHAEPMPQLLLIAELPDAAWTNRLVTAVRLGHSVDIGAAIIGDWPTGTTLTVAADGTTGTDTRLGVLDTTTAIASLGLLREAHGDSDGPVRTQQPPPRTADTQPEPARDPEHPSESGSEAGSGSEPAGPTAPPGATPTAAPDPDDGRRPVVVRVLGRPAVLDPDGQPSPGIRSKAVELLVYLAVNRNGADLSDIMEALFPDANLRRASERLSTVAADLRKHIRRAAATPTDTTETLRKRVEPIPNTGSRYHIDPTIVAVDWWTVLDHYEAVAATTDTSQQLAHLTAAIDTASGGLAQGAEYDWIDTDREVVRRHRIKLHVHAAALLADTDPHRSWLLLEQACEIDPLSDELARATMRAAATLGDADAIRHRLKTLREALDAHGLDITDDTETLARDLLRELHPPRTSE